MGGTMSNLDWVALPVSLIAHFFELSLAGRWTDAISRLKYENWRERLNSWIAFPGWFWQPLLFVLQALVASAIFLYWRNSFPVDKRVHRDAIMGLTVANVFFLKMWTPLLLWGPSYWWGAAIDSFFVLGTSAAVVALMGVERAWLPFGLYIIYPFIALIILITTILFYWNADLMIRGMKGMRGRYRRARGFEEVIPEGFEAEAAVRYAAPRGPIRQPARAWH